MASTASYVDIAGIDIYPGSGYGQPTEDVYPKSFQIMQQVAPGKMLAMCESGIPLNPDLMLKDGPRWLYNLQWFEGDVDWDQKVYSHGYIVTLDKLPVIRSIKCTMQMDILRCKTPDMVHKEIWTHLLAYNLLRTVKAVAANENDIEPRKVSFKGAKQALTAFAPKIEAARPKDRGRLIDAMLTSMAYHRVSDRPGRWEPRARKRRPKHAARLTQPRHIAKLPHNRSKWF